MEIKIVKRKIENTSNLCIRRRKINKIYRIMLEVVIRKFYRKIKIVIKLIVTIN